MLCTACVMCDDRKIEAEKVDMKLMSDTKHFTSFHWSKATITLAAKWPVPVGLVRCCW